MKMDKISQIYDKSYSKFTPEWFENSARVDRYLMENAESILNFYNDYAQQFNFPSNGYHDLKVLDLGCGMGGVSLFFASKGAQVTGVDVSSLAIMGAQQVAKQKGRDVRYIQMDICDYPGVIDEYDLIIDSHLLHCLTSKQERDQYWQFVRRHLKAETGIILLETMCYQSQIQIPVGYSFDEDNTLWQFIDDAGEEYPVRKIINSIDLEEEIKRNQLDINYLYYHSELAFEVFSEYQDYPFKYLPRTLRLAARKTV
jgi:2-polyprenyl-3-methyl-5-hydroxy-6-metoxy-1,4-benzoquinol methylase